MLSSHLLFIPAEFSVCATLSVHIFADAPDGVALVKACMGVCCAELSLRRDCMLVGIVNVCCCCGGVAICGMIDDGENRGGEFVGRDTLRAIMEAEFGPKALL